MVSWYCQFLLSGLRTEQDKKKHKGTGGLGVLYPNNHRLHEDYLSLRSLPNLPVGLDDLIDLVNFAVQSPSCNESG